MANIWAAANSVSASRDKMAFGLSLLFDSEGASVVKVLILFETTALIFIDAATSRGCLVVVVDAFFLESETGATTTM